MTKPTQTKTKADKAEVIPEVTPEDQAQVAVRESMDIDPNTGAKIRVGLPERTDEELVQDFLVWLQEKADASNEDTMKQLADQLRGARTAESVAEALKEKYTISGKDFVGVPFLARGFDIHEGTFEDEDIPFFASIDAEHPNHPAGFIANCGGMKVLVHLQTLERLNAFPLVICFTGATTRKGRTVLSIDKVEQTPL